VLAAHARAEGGGLLSVSLELDVDLFLDEIAYQRARWARRVLVLAQVISGVMLWRV
jgi:hypothetical protein